MSSINKRDVVIVETPQVDAAEVRINLMFIELTNQISKLRERVAELEKRPAPTRHVHWLDMSR